VSVANRVGILHFRGYFIPVSKLTRTWAALMLAAYVLAAMHCVLEAVPGFAFLKSCCFVESAPNPSPDSQECDSDGCAVEKAKYRIEEHRDLVPQPKLSLALLPLPSDLTITVPIKICYLTGQPPPELLQSWQFYLRAAWPPRAPSDVA
jgi:hypothetical protein